ncbi:MAG: leucine--tRNA ligase [Candidatus Spechtbacterales bacterium]|nr:leucine--tRNA ligase [Candidatus Spechtbacterales bacterium]
MEDFNPIKIEEKWRKKWEEEKRWEVDIENAENPYYNLMMFPYPSAEGLHIGNVYAFTGSDVHGRYMRMQGYDVFEPIGFDAFGIHSENFAIKQGMHPRDLIKKSTDNFRRQLKKTGNIYAWDHEVNTTHPKYYKWTQWLFLQLYKAGLAYHKEAPVQWCPSCMTVLANEQVIQGKCERCDSVVESKKLRQWFFKITDYADKLLDNLQEIDWSERTKIAQHNWIGKSIGYKLEFPVSKTDFSITTFTTRPDTLFGATYVVLSPEHHLVDQLKDKIENWDEVAKYIEDAKKKPQSEKLKEDREKTGVQLKGVNAVNPANKDEIPIFVADYVLVEYGTGAIMAVPAHDQRDFDFAVKYHMPIRPVVVPENDEQAKEITKNTQAYEGQGKLINSGPFDGLNSEEAKEKIGEHVEGEQDVHYHLRDWLISRQRYWGPPIPIIFCENCRKNQNEDAEEGIDWTTIEDTEYAVHPVPEKDLPVELPYVEDYKPKGKGTSPLAAVDEFVNVKCPECGEGAIRETDVSDTFLDSAWYFLRYPSINVESKPWDGKLNDKWLPVDAYIGGQEHAVLHLMYARFITMFLHDQGALKFEEPFKKFRAHGLLIKEGAKISKSRGNIVNPDEFFDHFGADTVRTYLMFLSPFEQGGDWRDEGIRGVHRFFGRVWGLVQKLDEEAKTNETVEQELHKTIKKVTEDIERLHYNTAIASMMTFLNTLYDNSHTKEDIKTLLILLTPFAPFITEELWEQLGEEGSVHDQEWPKFDPEKAKDDVITIPVQINGKVRAEIEVERGLSKEELEKAAMGDEKVKESMEGKEVKKIIVVPDKIVNIVV